LKLVEGDKDFCCVKLEEGIRILPAQGVSGAPTSSGTQGVGPVLLVSPWYRPSVGGVVECAEFLRRVLTEAGVETHLFVVEEKNDNFRLQRNPTVENVWHLQIPSYFFHTSNLKSLVAMFGRAPAVLWQVFCFVRSQNIRTMILNYPAGYSWVFLLVHYVLRINLIAAYLGNDITRYVDQLPAMKWLTRRVLRGSDAISVCGGHMIAITQGLFPHQPLPIHLLTNCIDVHHFEPPPPGFSRKVSRPTIVHISIFAPKKRTLDIIEAFALADLSQDTRLVMVGEGPDLPAAKELARRRNVEHRVEFVGGQKDVRPFMWEADLFVLASEDEGAPLALVEAMACGLPWVSPAWGAASILPSGDCGLTVPCRSPKDLAAALTELMADPERRSVMGKRARLRAETEFSGEAHLSRYLQLIEEVERHKPLTAVASPRPSE
jgi:glycosyltransferase involved in cell wall biosynthesis